MSLFPPTQAAAYDRLTRFVPDAGTHYAQRRNFDDGETPHTNVSTLSPYVRARVLDEIAVTRAVLTQHDTRQADKFLTEVFWRTYWKGWMELRPGVWVEYRNALDGLKNDIQTQSGLRQRWEAACNGDSGIAPLDAWAQELTTTGYLHNHARMWFASIWIFTLGLPWQLGADFFLRHLLDGDAAVNTLSWRWVAGLQTRGKTYLATPDNIETFTGGRYRNVTGLATNAPAVSGPENPAAGTLPESDTKALPARYGILLHDDDMDLKRILDIAPNPAAIGYLECSAGHSPWHMVPHVSEFRSQLARSVTELNDLTVLSTPSDLSDWAGKHKLDQIVTPYAPVGPTQATLYAYETSTTPVPLGRHRRPLETAAWPLATKGFFPFRKHIPNLIGQFVLT